MNNKIKELLLNKLEMEQMTYESLVNDILKAFEGKFGCCISVIDIHSNNINPNLKGFGAEVEAQEYSTVADCDGILDVYIKEGVLVIGRLLELEGFVVDYIKGQADVEFSPYNEDVTGLIITLTRE